MTDIKDKILADLSVYGMECYRVGKVAGREEVIEEIANKSFCEWNNCEDCAMWGKYDEFEEEVCILEQLKEQNK